MRIAIAAAFALMPTSLAAVQTSPLPAPAATAATENLDLGDATPIPGSWNYESTADGSVATFSSQSGFIQVWMHCTRATRRVMIARPAAAAAPFVGIWSSSLAKSEPASFDPTTGRLTVDLAPYDPLLDAIATSRGRIGFAVAGQAPIVVPAWAEPARVIEDCRA